MVKYADRGLVEESGSVSPLFETLYLVVCVTLTTVFSIFAFYPNKKSNFNLMCMKKSVSSEFESMKSISLLLSVTLPFLLILIFMFCAILYFLRSRGFSKRVPPIIGKYRRNILSLRETFVVTIVFYIFLYFDSFLLKFHEHFGISIEVIRIYAFTNSLVVHNLLEGVIWPFFILWNLNKKMPEFYSNPNIKSEKIFYVSGNKNIEPRRYDVDIQTKYFKNNFQRTSNSVFLNHAVKKSLLELPSVDV